MNYNEIIQKIKDSDVSIYELAYMDYDSNNLGLGPVSEVDQYGGEDKGSTWYSVQHFTDHDVYIKVSGYYSSYEGTEFYGGFDECCSEVKPVQKTVTVFDKI